VGVDSFFTGSLVSFSAMSFSCEIKIALASGARRRPNLHGADPPKDERYN
jgi:hypothetical protein